MLPFEWSDGGRVDCGFPHRPYAVSDCVIRAIAIARKRPYAEVYEDINIVCARRRKGRAYSHTGPCLGHYLGYLQQHGWKYYEPVERAGLEVLPTGRLIVRVQTVARREYHCMAVINRVVLDNYDWQRHNRLRVLGFFEKSRGRG
jgi:hypothetical protein